jgi:uncharacterized membrane protein YdjX (TVP38/TMEM64 family)
VGRRMDESGKPPTAVLRAAADPDEPIRFDSSVTHLVPPVDASSKPSPLRIWIPAAVAAVAVALISSTVQDTLVATAGPSTLWIGAGAVLLANLALIPLELVAIAAGVFLGALRGGIVGLFGSLIAAAIGYMAGRAIGPTGLTRWMSRRSYRSVRQLGARGVVGVIVLRLASVASAGSIHLLCGAGRVPFATFVAGSAIGLVPPIFALAGLGALLRRTLLQPSVSNALITLGAALLLIALAAGLRAFLLIRQFAPAVSRHRDRAEFG